MAVRIHFGEKAKQLQDLSGPDLLSLEQHVGQREEQSAPDPFRCHSKWLG